MVFIERPTREQSVPKVTIMKPETDSVFVGLRHHIKKKNVKNLKKKKKMEEEVRQF